MNGKCVVLMTKIYKPGEIFSDKVIGPFADGGLALTYIEKNINKYPGYFFRAMPLEAPRP